ncbi:MAG: LamG domain-containing protein [Actinomycetota bacterium]|nr:LamG domain-containing protein [Actinomycetota bacterium]
MTRQYTLGPEATGQMRASGSQSTAAMQLGAGALDQTIESLATSGLLVAMNQIRNSNPLAWWYFGEVTEFAALFPSGIPVLDLRLFYSGVVHFGTYAGSPVRNTIGYPYDGYQNTGRVLPTQVLRIPGPQVRNQMLDGLLGVESVATGLGAGASATIPDDGLLTFGPAEDFAVEGWIKTTASNCAILTKLDAGSWPYRLAITSAGYTEASRSDTLTQPTVTSPHVVNDNAWHRILFSKSGSTLSLFVDEFTAATATDTTTGLRSATANTASVVIGAEAPSQLGVAQFTVYGHSFTTTESTNHYRSMLSIPVDH